MTALGLLQRHLNRLYRTGVKTGVENFVIGDGVRKELAKAGAITARYGAREEVYVLQEGGDLSLAVYLDAKAQRAVENLGQNGTLTLDHEDFADFCVALEGVSHFVLLVHRAGEETPVTQLELELQAEIDKYLAARLLAWRCDNGPVPQAISNRLFANVSLATGLSSEQRERYRTANKLAHNYCLFLERTFLRERRMISLLRELCRFYRSPQDHKMRAIGPA